MARSAGRTARAASAAPAAPRRLSVRRCCRRTHRCQPAHPAAPSRSTPRSSSGSSVLLTSLDGLGVEIEQPTVRVVRLLQYFIRRAAVSRPELILWVEGGGIQRLASVEARDLALDGPVVERLRLTCRPIGPPPEPHVHIRHGRVERIEVPRDLRVALRQWTQPHGLHPGLPVEEVEELTEPCSRNLDVLDDVLEIRLASGPVDPRFDAIAPLERDELPEHVGTQPALRPHLADRGVLRAERTRAPEPVGVPPPEVVANGQVVLG